MIFFNKKFFYCSIFFYILLYTPCSFAYIFGDTYDKDADAYILLYNAQKVFTPHDIVAFVSKKYKNRKRPIRVHLILFVWDCEKMTRHNHSGFWFSLFGSKRKRDRYLRMCNEDTEAMKDASYELQQALSEINHEWNEIKTLNKARLQNGDYLNAHVLSDIRDSQNTIARLNRMEDLFMHASQFGDNVHSLLKEVSNFLFNSDETTSYREFLDVKNRILKDFHLVPGIDSYIDKLESILFRNKEEKIENQQKILLTELSKYKVQSNKTGVSIDFPVQDRRQIQELGQNLSHLYQYFREVTQVLIDANKEIRLYVRTQANISLPPVYYDYFYGLDHKESVDLEKHFESAINDLNEHFIEELMLTYTNGFIPESENLPTLLNPLREFIESPHIGSALADIIEEKYHPDSYESAHYFFNYLNRMEGALSYLHHRIDLNFFKEDIELLRSESKNHPDLLKCANSYEENLNKVFLKWETRLSLFRQSIYEAGDIVQKLRIQIDQNYKSTAFYQLTEVIKMLKEEEEERLEKLYSRESSLRLEMDKTILRSNSRQRRIINLYEKTFGIHFDPRLNFVPFELAFRLFPTDLKLVTEAELNFIKAQHNAINALHSEMIFEDF